MTSFGERLREAVGKRGPLCAGIDPHPSLLTAWGLDESVAGLERFALTAVEAFAPLVATVKPQSAFFERFGSRGIAVLEKVVEQSRAAGALVIMDAKRGDIGSTSAAYAAAYLDKASPLFVDALTVSPYLGFGSLQPFIEEATDNDAGLFVLAHTSNPEGAEVQRAVASSGNTVGEDILRHLAEINLPAVEAGEWGSFGAVIGATITAPEGGFTADFGGPVLAPGYGAQGATIGDLTSLFGTASGRVLPNSSRALLAAGPDLDALREATRRVQDEVSALS